MPNEPKAPTWPEPPTPPHADAPTPLHDDTQPDMFDHPMTEAERAAERVAFAELVAFVKANKDPDTEVTHATADDFAATLEQ